MMNRGSKDMIRVGVVGIKGSGRSTLINAVLGSNILPSAVVPVPGCLLTCVWGEEYAAQVSFEKEGSEDVVLKGDDFTLEKLLEYSDERMNRSNFRRVKSIHIQSPNFDLGSGVVLVDNPKILPVMDVCLLVTSVDKPESGDRVKEILDIAGIYDCPVMVVQNKLDLINDPEADHLEVIRDAVEKSGIRNKDGVLTVLMSAHSALKWKLNEYHLEKTGITQDEYDSSNYPEFIIKIKYLIKKRKTEASCEAEAAGPDESTGENAKKGVALYADIDERILFFLNIADKLCLRQHREIMKRFLEHKKADGHLPFVTGGNAEKIRSFVHFSGITDFRTFSFKRHREILKNDPEDKCYFILINGSGSDNGLNEAIKKNTDSMVSPSDMVFWVIQDFDVMLELNEKVLKERLNGLIGLHKNENSVIWLMHNNPVYNLAFLRYQEKYNGQQFSLSEQTELLSGLRTDFEGLCDLKVLLEISRMIAL